MAKKELDVLVISDVHLGTYGCHAKELLNYLSSVAPKQIVLNGDIIDMWQFSKSYFPDTHVKILRKILKFVSEGIPVHYLTGNHDEVLRKFADSSMGNLHLANKLLLELEGKKAWFFHGDVFDVTMQHSKWLAKLGAIGYDSLILLNSLVNWFLVKMGKRKYSFSRKIKASVKEAVKFINKFEQTAADIAIEKGYDYVICGHIHHAEKREVQTALGIVTYLNSGDWVESLTALEYQNGNWSVYNYNSKDFQDQPEEEQENLKDKMDVVSLLHKLVHAV
ncbi:metallophosphoesterase [Pseudopedobacter saltans DSM 12145]|uniref:Metallophosphoesterase n=1 Tax=Pseudopedobacter saltans (strain ATCC 51119 / DSM 12145 / JCM 21818 / CCUG 39354 / LMG 10337 / NBRC 100064 / NCIMB 13643) TaxID=762903 RepID=F0SBC1_PSESL|nr:UDP-2,3-diacylglucosamine diphosphatase [Pseudopedobacter saltans]ADY53748.1 metallophosphoesterase [Pseudopedobacter saltans DSM 12145]